jgi:hypothetical protein
MREEQQASRPSPGITIAHYEGVLTSEVRIQLSDLVKAVAMASLGKRPNLKKLYGIAIELLDNAQRYGSTDGLIRFDWKVDGDHVVITIENKASKEDALRLLNTVEAVNSMSSEQLAEAFRAQLTQEGFGEKGGAGLGFLDIARKCVANGGPATPDVIQARIRPANSDEYFCESQVSTKLQ